LPRPLQHCQPIPADVEPGWTSRQFQGASISMDWRSRAACLDKDPELFFPVGNTGPALLQIEEAKSVCRRCEVTETCLQWAIESGQDDGVWGGMSEDERRALKRRDARARRASEETALAVDLATREAERNPPEVDTTGGFLL